MIAFLRRNLRRRITLWFTLVFGLITGIPGYLTYEHLKQDLYRHVDRDLAEKMRSVLRVMDRVQPEQASREFISGVFSGGTGGGEYLHYVQAKRHGDSIPVINTRPEGGDFIRAAARSGTNPCDATIGKGEFRVYRERHGDYEVSVATSMALLLHGLREIRSTYLYTFPLALLAASLFIYVIATRAFDPITAAARRAEKISAYNLQERLPPARHPDEVGELVDTLNRMIGRIQEGFGRIARFTQDAAHELQTPLTILRGELEVALRSAPAGERQHHLIRSNLEEVNRLISIVEDLFTLSQMDNNRLPIEFARVSLESLLEGLHEKALVLAKPKNICVELVDGEPLTVLGDTYRLIQLFLNLINNAIRYTAEGGRITLACEREGEYARVRVQDTGIGIPASELERIFDRFYRVDKARSREEGGTGLGLSIVKWIVGAHRGTIDVRSEVGKGSVFEVRLPLAAGRIIIGTSA